MILCLYFNQLLILLCHAKFLSFLGMSAATSAAVGAKAGAVLGSVVPGLGTAVGAAFGAGVGTAASMLTDDYFGDYLRYIG